MFLELLRKEFIEKKSGIKQSKVAFFFSLFLRAIVLASLVSIECFISISIDKKIQEYSPYPNGSFDFLVLFLFVLMGVGIVFTMVKARSTIFDTKDKNVTIIFPISPSSQVTAKVVYLLIESTLFQLAVSTPLIICYGALRNFIPYYYIFAVFYAFFISIFIVGISLILALGYQKLYVLIKKSWIAQFVVASVLVIGLCFVYQFVLNMFLTALNDSAIGGLFSESFVAAIHSAKNYFLPVYHLMESVAIRVNTLSDIMIFIGSSVLSMILGIFVMSFAYLHELKNNDNDQTKPTKKKELKLLTPWKALVKKEMAILFKDENNVFSYTSLLIMCPFLTYVVIASLNGIIYDNLRFYAAFFPELVSGINLTLILLFVGVINASVSLSMTREGKGIKVLKTIPVSPLLQIFTKILLPFGFSEASLILTLIILISTSVITVPVFFASAFIGTLILAFSNVFGVYADMHDKSSDKKRIKMTAVNSAVPVILPLIIFLLFFVLSLLKLPSWSLYLIGCCFAALCLLPFTIGLKKRYQKFFVKMEVSN